MAIARIIEAKITPDQYDQLRDRLGAAEAPPAGGAFHVAAIGEDGNILTVEIWDSREQAEAWTEKVAAARREAGIDAPVSIEYLEIHNVVQR
jgi:hypothetical protein